MEEREIKYKDQRRWNEAYGKANLDKIRRQPEEFIIDQTKLSKPKLDIIKEMSNIKGKKILEFGSGKGELSVMLAKLGGLVIGIDIGIYLVELSKKIAAINNVTCEFIVGSIDSLPCKNNTFDFVVGAAIIHHLSQSGVSDSLKEAYRVLKPGGIAIFYEPIENSRIFNFIQNLFPVGKPNSPQHRPSILQRKNWKKFIQMADDRALSNKELIKSKGPFKYVEFKYYGLLIRLGRLFSNPKFERLLINIDLLLTHRISPIKKLSRSVLVKYKK